MFLLYNFASNHNIVHFIFHLIRVWKVSSADWSLANFCPLLKLSVSSHLFWSPFQRFWSSFALSNFHLYLLFFVCNDFMLIATWHLLLNCWQVEGTTFLLLNTVKFDSFWQSNKLVEVQHLLLENLAQFSGSKTVLVVMWRNCLSFSIFIFSDKLNSAFCFLMISSMQSFLNSYHLL